MATPSAILQQTAHTTYILGWSSLSLALHMVSQTDVSHSALCVIVNQNSIKDFFFFFNDVNANVYIYIYVYFTYQRKRRKKRKEKMWALKTKYCSLQNTKQAIVWHNKTKLQKVQDSCTLMDLPTWKKPF